MEWNESNSIPFQNKFYHDAYRKQRYAFAADCIRVQVLHTLGGVYLDTDMLILKPLDNLLSYSFFTGYEVEGRPAYGLFGAEAGNHFIAEMKRFYDTQYFNPFSPPVITHTFKELIVEKNLQEEEAILPVACFYPQPYQEKGMPIEKYITPSTYAVHLWDHSWKKPKRETFWHYVGNFNTVLMDTVLYGYPRAYFRRYAKEFARKAYHKLIGKKV